MCVCMCVFEEGDWRHVRDIDVCVCVYVCVSVCSCIMYCLCVCVCVSVFVNVFFPHLFRRNVFVYM